MKILIAEDDRMLADALKELLEGRGEEHLTVSGDGGELRQVERSAVVSLKETINAIVLG